MTEISSLFRVDLDGFDRGSILVKGASDNLRMLMSRNCLENRCGSVFVVFESDEKARTSAERAGLENAVHYPQNPIMHEYISRRSTEMTEKRVRVIERLVRGERLVVMLSAAAFTEKGVFFSEDNIKEYRVGDITEMDSLKKGLEYLGYSREEEISGPGAYMIKGGIIDVFIMGDDNPTRIEFFDDEIDSVRFFDCESRKSLEERDCFRLRPARTGLIEPEKREMLRKRTIRELEKKGNPRFYSLIEKLRHSDSDITKYIQYGAETKTVSELSENPVIVIDDYADVKKSLEGFLEENERALAELLDEGKITPSQRFNHHDFRWMEERIGKLKSLVFFSISMPANSLYQRELIEIYSSDNQPQQDADALSGQIRSRLSDGYRVILSFSSDREREYLEDFRQAHLEDVGDSLSIENTGTDRGFSLLKQKIALYTFRDLTGRRKAIGRARKRRAESRDAFFSEISRGDYVVHDQHGIGRYVGMKSMEAGGVTNDYLEIEFAGSDRLYVNAAEMDSVSRYIGSEGARPRLSRLGTKAWDNMKDRTLDSVRKLADEYIQMYAARQSIIGHAFAPDGRWQSEFENSFEYVLTEDQQRCLDEIKADMEKPVPMDRLLCGDVGFGKTEVAVRAAFKAVMDSKQVAVLVPTTILAMQHFQTFSERMKDYPVRIEMLSRFKTQAQANRIISDLSKGKIDIVIGTHRLLSDRIEYLDLGLLIVDEEQRFGVAHKDRLKVLKHSVDTLTLSATPIPRTLNMSLVGIRDLSTIEMAPRDRQETETYVTEYDEFIIKDAVKRELSRGGQVFFVYNSVIKAEKMKRQLEEILGDARIECINGRMSTEQIEDVMMRFIERKFDVLVCTSIIENGLNVLNANTMIIKDAQNFGLSQLYQLRGRVGRSTRNAYCYITYDADRAMSESAKKRLKAIEEFTKFGSGFQIAVRDLQIRGAGNLLGANQSGHFANIGYELYTRMLKEAFKGKKEGERRADTRISLKSDAYIPDDFIENEADRIRIYKRIAAVSDEGVRSELIDDIVDIYGDVPKPLARLIDVSLLRNRASRQMVERISADEKLMYFDFDPKLEIRAGMINALHERFGARFIRNDRFIRVGFPFRKQRNLADRLVLRALDIIENMEGFVV